MIAQQNLWYGRLMVAGAALLWSMAGILQRLVSVDAYTVVFWRAGLGGLLLLAVVLVRSRGSLAPFARMGKLGWGLAIWFGVESTLFVLAFDNTSIANALIIIAVNPLIAALLAWIILKEKIAAHTALALAVCMGGICYMVWGSLGGGTLLGDALAFIVALMFACVIIVVRKFGDVDLIPAFAVGGLVAAAISLIFAQSPFDLSSADAFYLSIFGFGEFGVSVVIFIAGAKRIPTIETAMIGLVETALAPVFVWFAVGENPGLRALIGGAVVLGSLLIYTLVDWRRSRGAAIAH